MSDIDAILDQAARIPFVTLVAWIERTLGKPVGVGGDGPFRDEAIRFRHDPSLSFHRHDVSSAKLDSTGTRIELTTTFAGLTGSASPLAPMFIEAMARDDEDAEVEREFLDVFHHRLLSLFYRGMLKNDLSRTATAEPVPRMLRWLLTLAGFPFEHAERTSGLELGRLLRFLPLLVGYPANGERLAVALRDVLHDVLDGATVKVQPMTGGYVTIEESARPRLGVDMRLGRTAGLGGRAASPASEVCVQIAPLPPTTCARLSPGGDRHDQLMCVALLFAPETVQVVIELTPTHAPKTALGSGDAKLGRSSWLGGRGQPRPVRFRAEPILKEHHAS